jgi:hypothetical protein
MLEIKEVDLDRWSFEESTLISKNHDLYLFNYLHGRCHIFALALKRVFKDRAKIMCVIDLKEKKMHVDDLYLSHAYVEMDNNTMLDSRGLIELEDIEEYTAECIESYYLESTEEFVLSKCNQEGWGSELENEISDLEIFIQNNIEMYEQKLHKEEELKKKYSVI